MNIGDKVVTGVFVLGKFQPMSEGIITRRIDSQLVEVDVMSLHGGRPWLRVEQESHLRLADALINFEEKGK